MKHERKVFLSSALIGKESIEDAAQSNFHHLCPCSCLHLPLSGQRYTPSAMPMQMVAWTLLKRSRFVAQLSHSVSFSITNPSIWLCRASKGSGGEEKVQCWFSSSTFFGFEQRSRPCCHLLCTARSSHQPACLGPLCHDSKSVLASKFAQPQLHPI